MTGLQIIEYLTFNIASTNSVHHILIKNEPILFQLTQLKTIN